MRVLHVHSGKQSGFPIASDLSANVQMPRIAELLASVSCRHPVVH
jgi:hypothetical protein